VSCDSRPPQIGSIPEEDVEDEKCPRSGDDSLVEARPEDAPDPDTDSPEDLTEGDLALGGGGFRLSCCCESVSMLKKKERRTRGEG
jgi:hypothetical protein